MTDKEWVDMYLAHVKPRYRWRYEASRAFQEAMNEHDDAGIQEALGAKWEWMGSK